MGTQTGLKYYMNKFRITALLTGLMLSLLPGCKAQNKSLMGQGQKVLVIGRHTDMLEKVKTMLQTHGYQPLGALTNEEAVEVFKKELPQAVLIGGGVDEPSRKFFHSEFSKILPSVKVIDAHPQTVLEDLKKTFR